MWVLQANLRDQAFLAQLERELSALGEAWCKVPVVPFSPALPELPFETEQVICYGPSFVPRVAASAWRPGIFFDEASFRWSAMAAHWGELMFSSDAVVTALADLDLREPRFVRPDADSKVFDGGVIDDEATLRGRIGTTPLDTPVMSAPVRAVDAEWRCFVVDGEVVDSSEYRRAGRPSLFRAAPPRALELAEQAAARWLPAPVTCIDIASSGDHFGVVEANCFNASRFYAADVATVLRAVSRYALAAC